MNSINKVWLWRKLDASSVGYRKTAQETGS